MGDDCGAIAKMAFEHGLSNGSNAAACEQVPQPGIHVCPSTALRQQAATTNSTVVGRAHLSSRVAQRGELMQFALPGTIPKQRCSNLQAHIR